MTSRSEESEQVKTNEPTRREALKKVWGAPAITTILSAGAIPQLAHAGYHQKPVSRGGCGNWDGVQCWKNPLRDLW